MLIQSFFYHMVAARDFAMTLQYRGVGYGGFNGPGGGGRGGAFGFVGGGLRGGSAEASAVTLAAMLTGLLGGSAREFRSAAAEAVRAGVGFQYDLGDGAGSVAIDPLGEWAAQGYAVSLNPHDGNVGPTVEGVMTGTAMIAAAGAIGWTGWVLAQAGAADLGHAGHAVGATAGIGAVMVPAAILGDGLVMSVGGVLFVAAAGGAAGIALNDYFIAPTINVMLPAYHTPSVSDAYSYLKGH